jgi:hypothetical protein
MSYTICQAIAREEGFNLVNSRSSRNNNPGDINYGAFAIDHGATRIETVGLHQVARFAYFPNAALGFVAMKALLAEHYTGMTVLQMLNKYAPPVENQTNSYITNVCTWTGLTPSTIIDDYL